MSYLAAFGMCIAAAAFEGLCAGRDPMGQLRRLRQPRWSPPDAVWVAIAIAWYAICATALVRLLVHWPRSAAAVLLLVALMFANGLANWLQFRLERLDWALAFFAPYWLLLAWFIVEAWPLDRVTGGLFGLYALYQLYAVAWAHALWRLNPRRA